MLSILLGIYLGMKFLGHMVALCLTFQGTAKLFSKEAVSFYIPSAVCEDFNFSASLSTLGIVHPFYCSHPCGYEMVSRCGQSLILKVKVKRHPRMGIGHIQFDNLYWRSLISVLWELDLASGRVLFAH